MHIFSLAGLLRERERESGLRCSRLFRGSPAGSPRVLRESPAGNKSRGSYVWLFAWLKGFPGLFLSLVEPTVLDVVLTINSF